MSIIAPLPKSGIAPKQESHHYDMVRPAPYLPLKELDALAYNRLVDVTAQLMAPPGEIIARPYQDHYEVIFGFDYLRAYQEVAPRGQVLLNIYHYSDQEAVRVSMDLAAAHFHLSPIHLAESYEKALRHFEWRNSELARALGLKRSTITNRLKLTRLENEVKEALTKGDLSLEHAKMLSRLSRREQVRFAKLAVQHNWDTRKLYKQIHPDWKPKGAVIQGEESLVEKDGDHVRLEKMLGDILGCPVNIDVEKKKGYKGKLRVPFFSIGELAGFVEKIERSTKEEQRWKGEIQLTIEGLDHLDGILTDLYPQDEF